VDRDRRAQRRPVPAPERCRTNGLPPIEPVGGEVGRLRRARQRPFRLGRPGKLLQRGRPADGAARMESDNIASSWGRKRLVGVLLIALSVLAIPVAMFVPFSSWLGSLKANSAMAVTPAPIDGKRAFRYLEQICELGPRIAG